MKEHNTINREAWCAELRFHHFHLVMDALFAKCVDALFGEAC